MTGIMMLTDATWQAYQERESLGTIAVFYASPSKRSNREYLDPLFCVRSGKLPRAIVASGKIQAQVLVDQDTIWTTYGASLGASTEREWRVQASSVLINSQMRFAGKLLAIELVDFRASVDPIWPSSVGLSDDGWSKMKEVDGATANLLLARLYGRNSNDDLVVTSTTGGGFGDADSNQIVERAAISTIKARYEAEDWVVRSVEDDQCGYDLECTRSSDVIHVEVKGTAGSVESFIITAGEVKQAKINPRFHIAVVTMATSANPVVTSYTGAEFVTRFSLAAIQYKANLRQPTISL